MSSMIGGFGFGRGSGKKIPGYHQRSISMLSPEQQDIFSRLYSGLGGGLEGGLAQLSKLAAGDEEQFAQLEAPALRQFGALQGQLASRFSGMGTGARRSSGFGHATTAASQELAERLQAQRLGLQQNAIRDLLGLSQSLLGRQTQENLLIPKQRSPWQDLLASSAAGIGQGLGTYGSSFLL